MSAPLITPIVPLHRITMPVVTCHTCEWRMASRTETGQRMLIDSHRAAHPGHRLTIQTRERLVP